jgi:hypothetical protein
MQFEIKNRWTGNVQFVAEIDCKEDAPILLRLGLAVKWAVENKANLSGANLSGANLSGANLSEAHGLNDYVKCIQIDTYPITYTAAHMQIGCQRHEISEWANFTDAQIRAMDGKKALDWWARFKPWIFQTIELCPAKPTKEVA